MKQEYLPFKDINYWSKIYAESLRNWSITFGLINPEDFFFLLTNVEDVVTHIDEYFTEYYKELDVWKKVLSILRIVTSAPFLDIYTITRIFKKPDGGNRSSLSFGYFGNIHVKNIVDLLLATNKQVLVNLISNEANNRCLDITFSLNLDEEVRKYNMSLG